MSTFGKVLLVFVFLASVGFLYVGARALKTHQTHREIYNAWVQALADREARIKVLEGTAKEENPNDSAVARGLLQVGRELDMLLANQGRVWRDCKLGGRNQNTLTVVCPSANPGITDKGVLYVFEQHPQPALAGPGENVPEPYVDGIHSNNRPLVYLGKFKVTAAAGNQITLQPTRDDPTMEGKAPRLTDSQQQALANSAGPFALYEKCPADLHAVWQRLKKDHPPERFERFFDKNLLPQEQMAKLIAEFRRDGEEPLEGDLDERILVEVKFLKDYADLTDAERTELQTAGFSIVNLRTPSGEPVKDAEGKAVQVDIGKVIQKDTIAYFMRGLPDGKTGPGKKLLDMGIVQVEKQTYVRQLRDYPLISRQVLTDLPVLENRIQDLDINKAQKDDVTAKLKKDNEIQHALYLLLMEEQKTLTAERKAVQEYDAEVAEDLKQVLEKIKKLEDENSRLAAMIKQTQLEEAERINREARQKVSKEGN